MADPPSRVLAAEVRFSPAEGNLGDLLTESRQTLQGSISVWTGLDTGSFFKVLIMSSVTNVVIKSYPYH